MLSFTECIFKREPIVVHPIFLYHCPLKTLPIFQVRSTVPSRLSPSPRVPLSWAGTGLAACLWHWTVSHACLCKAHVCSLDKYLFRKITQLPNSAFMLLDTGLPFLPAAFNSQSCSGHLYSLSVDSATEQWGHREMTNWNVKNFINRAPRFGTTESLQTQFSHIHYHPPGIK